MNLGNNPLPYIHTVWGDSLSVTDDFEYAVGVLLDYATEDELSDDVEDALAEIAGAFGYDLVESDHDDGGPSVTVTVDMELSEDAEKVLDKLEASSDDAESIADLIETIEDLVDDDDMFSVGTGVGSTQLDVSSVGGTSTSVNDDYYESDGN